jgi:D-alanyl-D-alanine carboxypeptidase
MLRAEPIVSLQTNAWTAPASPGLGTITIKGDSPKLLLMRAAASAGCAGIIDPVLSLSTEDGKTLLATNDNWAVAPGSAAAIEAAVARVGLPALTRGSLDAALLVRLCPGTYSFRAVGKARTWERATVFARLIEADDLQPSWPLTVLGIGQSARATSKAPAMVVSRITNKSISSATDGFIRSDSTVRAAAPAFYNIGSCGKSVTATLAGLLVDEGKLRWTSTLAEVFPDLASGMNVQIKAVTLEQLLAHRAGFDGYLVASDIATLPTFTGTPKQQRLALVTHLTAQAPVLTIGDFSYSNAGVSIGAAMLERVSGKAYEDLVRDRVMKPLGAEVVFGYPASAAPKGRQTWGHVEFGGTQLVHEPSDPNFAPYNFPAAFVPAGTFSMTNDGLARYVQMHLRALRGEPALLKQSTAQYLHRPYGGGDTGYALGWEVRLINGVRTSQHNGSLDPYFAQMAIQPARNMAAIAIASASDEATTNAVEQATMLALGAPIGSADNVSLLAHQPHAALDDQQGRARDAHVPPHQRIEHADALPRSGPEFEPTGHRQPQPNQRTHTAQRRHAGTHCSQQRLGGEPSECLASGASRSLDPHARAAPRLAGLSVHGNAARWPLHSQCGRRCIPLRRAATRSASAP